MKEISDEDLVRLCREGDVKAFDVLVERHQRTVYNLALRMVRDPDEAADVSQTAFIKAYEKLEGFDTSLKFFSWLYRIALNESLTALQRNKRFDRMDGVNVAIEPEEGEDDATISRERKVQEGLMMLKFEQRSIIILKHMQGLSYREIGQVLDMSEKTVKSRLFSARQSLKEILRKKGLGPHDQPGTS